MATERSLREVHEELKAHVEAGTLTEEVYERLLEEERAMSWGGVIECGTSWMLARERAGLR